MIRGTTPTHYFKIPFNVSEIKTVKVIYAQDDEKLFEKKTEDCKLYDKTIETSLTQEETIDFDSEKRVQIQIRILTKSGAALNSYIKIVPVYKCLENEVLT